jgi:ribosomal protein S2
MWLLKMEDMLSARVVSGLTHRTKFPDKAYIFKIKSTNEYLQL